MINTFQYVRTVNIDINQVVSIILGVIISLTVMIVAIPATFITGNLRKRKLYIWWSHFWMFLSSILFLIIPSVGTLIFLNVAIGMSLGSLSVHELMFNEQYFSKSHAFLTFTMLSIPPLLSSLLVNGIIGTVVIDVDNNFKQRIILGLGIGFLCISLILSFLLKEIRPFQVKKIVILIVIGVSIYSVYYLMNNNYFNYKNDMITHNETLKPYSLLINYLPQVVGAFILGWWLYYYFNAQFTLIVSFSLWLLGIVINYASTNLYAHIISLAFGSTSFVIVLF
ncbi:hypothetical protein [Spiroplasma endosymbiont of Nebria brevicollis]|uniref:hypothetical protein n=1 Tax=Spiroplasma endosymbiont of Nebria brevicollis TaxID=3066284 RepID=UPI00313EC392